MVSTIFFRKIALKCRCTDHSPSKPLTSSHTPNNSHHNAKPDKTTNMTATATANSTKDEDTISYDHIPWPVRPSSGINYDFVVSLYLGGCALAFLFFMLEKQLLAPLLGGDEDSTNISDGADGGEDTEKEVDPWKEFAKGMQGMYVVFAPFLLCLPWSLVVRYYWMRETAKRKIE